MFPILVVDDDELMRDSLTSLLEEEGFQVAGAESGPRALEMAKEQYFELVVCDVRMPQMDGIETVGRLREAMPDATFIMMTGYASEDAPIQALRLGVDDYIRKPFEVPQFLSKVRSLCRRRRVSHRKESSIGLWQFLDSWSRQAPQAAQASEAVEAICQKVGSRLGWGASQTESLCLAAWLHPMAGDGGPGLEEEPTDGADELAATLAAFGRNDLASEPAQILRGALELREGRTPGGELAPEILEQLQKIVDEAGQRLAPAEADEDLVIRTFGECHIQYRGRIIESQDWESAKARWLFLYLVTRGGQAVSQERLAQLFWPENLKNTHRALVSTVHRARKALGDPELIIRKDGSYALNREVTYALDFDRFQEVRNSSLKHTHANNEEAAMACYGEMEELYKGEFLPRCFEDWAVETRKDIQRKLVESREKAAQICLNQDPTQAECWARKALALEDTSEVAHAALIHALALQKRRKEAKEAYDFAAQRLKEEYGLKPGPDIEKAYAAVSGG